MSLISLKPLDDGQQAVEIPLGKTTIGRGPFLGCSDKKVSRNHAVLEVTSKGEVYLTPTHVNPCFYQPTADSPGQILKKDIPYKLQNGDSFSLLPRAYRYQLIVEGESNQNENADESDNKELGKTNGSAVDLLHEEAATNDELGDTIVPEKAFTKEDASNTDKSCSKEENTFSKKIPEIKDNGEHNFAEDSQVNNAGEIVAKDTSPAKGNNISDAEPLASSNECKEDGKEDNCAKEAKGEEQPVRTESEANESSDEGYVDAEDKVKPPIVDRVTEENDSTLNTDSISRSTVLEADEKPLVENKLSLKSCDEKVSDEEPLPDEEPDVFPHDQSSNETEQSSIPHSDRVVASSSTKATRKAAVSKQPRKERQAPKRKAVASEMPSKPRGRKKANKMNFDDGQEGTSQRPGRTSSRTNRQTRQGLSLEDFIVSDDDEWQSDRSEPKPRRKRGRRRAEDSGSDWEVDRKKPKKPLHKAWSGSESGSERGSPKKRKGPKGKRKKTITDDPNEVISDDEPQASSSSKVKVDKPRIACAYGKKCYRRHPNHTKQFSHPGDTDYTSETEINQRINDAISESEEESPKKECPYGVNCFRKNPQHKKDFKHTKKVRPQREAAKQADKKAKSSRNSDEVDSYDLNDSFLNDDSDEYKPVDSGSDYESGEKMKRLAKVKASKSKRGKKA